MGRTVTRSLSCGCGATWTLIRCEDVSVASNICKYHSAQSWDGVKYDLQHPPLVVNEIQIAYAAEALT